MATRSPALPPAPYSWAGRILALGSEWGTEEEDRNGEARACLPPTGRLPGQDGARMWPVVSISFLHLVMAMAAASVHSGQCPGPFPPLRHFILTPTPGGWVGARPSFLWPHCRQPVGAPRQPSRWGLGWDTEAGPPLGWGSFLRQLEPAGQLLPWPQWPWLPVLLMPSPPGGPPRAWACCRDACLPCSKPP